MNELISKKSLLKDLDEVIAQYNQEDDGVIMDLLTSVRDMVSNKPIAYDIDTVVEQLENEATLSDVDGIGKCYAIDLQTAVIIVKRGGAENDS